jgi:hypothetical protein
VQNERDQPVELYLEDRVVHLGPHERTELSSAALQSPQVRLMINRHYLSIHPSAREEASSEVEQAAQRPDEPVEPTEEK